jgi:hypothetical protein
MNLYTVTLTEDERKSLHELASKGKHNSQQILNALILLNCDKSEWNVNHSTNEEISRVLNISMRKIDRAKKRFVEEGLEVALNGKESDRIYTKKVEVMDNLNTHFPGSLYETFPPTKAKALWNRFEFVYTPKHGSWLNIAEIELNVLTGQCLKRRMDNIEFVKKEVLAWQNFRNNKNSKVNWQFTTDDARIKLSRLYPTFDD